MFHAKALIATLQAQISRLEQLLEKERNERQQLLDRLLAKNNVEPVQPKPEARAKNPIQIVSPFGNAATPEMVEALKDSWVQEETFYLIAEHGLPEAQAKEMAEARWISEHKVID